MSLRFATPGCLVLSTRRCLKAMASLAGQYTRMQEFTAVFTVLRLLAPLKMSYVAAKKRANLYTKIVEELPQSVERRGSWYDRLSRIRQMGIRHCPCRHSQKCFGPNGCFRSVNPTFRS